jgi:hypothetical protein
MSDPNPTGLLQLITYDLAKSCQQFFATQPTYRTIDLTGHAEIISRPEPVIQDRDWRRPKWGESVSAVNQPNHNKGLNLRKAALIDGFAYLLSPVATAEFSLMPKLVIPGNIEQTIQNITAHGGMFVAAILCYFVTFIEDVVIAWALYVLLAPVNRAAA